MLPLLPAYLENGSLDDRVLSLVRFGRPTSLSEGVLTVALPSLGVAKTEVWRSPLPVMRGQRSGIEFAHNGQVLIGASVSNDSDIEAAARKTYEAIVRVARGEGYPFLLRVWNHVRDINSGAGDAERYKRFCTGRHESLTAANLQKHEFPSASAVGMVDGELAVYFVASRSAGRQVENPRQVSAYNYPREFGFRSPSFARATVARFGGDEIAFISGTASVVGHETRHAGDAMAQLEETIRNLERIVTESGATTDAVRALKVYVRRDAGIEAMTSALRSIFPAASLLVVESDTCRRDLLLEVEAIAVR